VSSALTWLATSADEQRRMQDLLGIFRDTESRDELGIGQIRDAFSDTLFPGTSVLHTRARYLLFVPWCYQTTDGRRTIRQVERRLVTVLQDAGATDGLIGSRAGPAVKTLPSTIYHTALRRYGIARDEPDAVAVLGDDGELLERVRGPWQPDLPAAPKGFPDTVEGGFALPYAEASWLRERILATCGGTLLTHLLTSAEPPQADTPWADPACRAAAEDIAEALRHAELFSLAMHGAALVYNLLLAEAYEAAGYTAADVSAADYADELAAWS
jgi:hypothetical protein